MATCANCNEKTNELTYRPDLMDPLGEMADGDPKTMLCDQCEKMVEHKGGLMFCCAECGDTFNGLYITHTSFGSFCISCMRKEGWEMPTLTPIPENGWSQNDIGRHVYVQGEQGVIIPDIVICSQMPHGQTIIGPGYVVGGILARMRHMHDEGAEARAIAEGMDEIRRFFEEPGEDEDGC